MLEYARWKYILIVVVLLLGLLLALPNAFGDDPALQVAKSDHSAITAESVTEVESFLKAQKVAFTKSYIDDGRLMVRFPDVPEQLKARDAVNEKYKNQYITALSFASRAPAFL